MLGFKLANHEEHSSLLDVSMNGVVSLKSVTDDSLLGLHLIKFSAYLNDFNPSAKYSQTIMDFTFPLKVENSQQQLGEDYSESLVREKPVTENPIEPLYSVVVGDTVNLTFHFANPIAIYNEAGIKD